jgi:hypothetical protein
MASGNVVSSNVHCMKEPVNSQDTNGSEKEF